LIDRDLRSAISGSGPRLIASNAPAARQWEAYYFDAAGGSAPTGVTPAVYSYHAWLADRWRTTLATDAPDALLTPPQTAALWRTVIEASPDAERLLELRHAARWAAQAHQLLADWNLGLADVENADASRETRAFVTWQRSYVALLAEHGWLDASSLPRQLLRFATPEALVLLDLYAPTKAQTVLFATLQSRGWHVEARTTPRVECTARHVDCHDSNEELERAAEWARRRLEAHPDTRVALVVPNLTNETAVVLQRIRRAFGASPVGSGVGLPLDARPAIGAALGAIELSTAGATFATLSRWLRSPFFHAGQAQCDAAAAEVALRNDLRAQLPFLTAYEQAGFAGRLAALVPDLAARLHMGLEELRAPRPVATPDVWARAWSRGLARLGWPAPGGGVDARTLDAWEEALAALARLTPIVGQCSQETAIEQLRATTELPRAEPLPLHGLHVLARADDVGPGYSAVWVTGVTDRSWPEPTRTNPLLPAGLQIRQALPWSTPADSLARARSTLARLLARTRELVLSWPRLVHDYHALPSPLLAGIATASAADVGPGRRTQATRPRRALASIADPAPAFSGARLPGSARTLDSQARCPIRAFCETRLDARSLSSAAQGLTPRVQGIAAHRALELLWSRAPVTGAASLPFTSDDIAASVQRALAETFGPARRALGTLFDLEAARLNELLARLVEAELKRPAFRTVGVEHKAEVLVGAVTIACRFDRLDELADGTLALIDYKTGASRTKAQWLDGRLASAQLPLYALEIGPRLSALLTLELGGRTIAYRGIARRPDLIADALDAVPDAAAWAALLERWRMQIQTLVEEYVGGDVRVYVEDWSDAAGEYAPLTRVYAHAALRHPEALHEN
jgi:probable DNA repair protein